ncbi:hypothetical protein B0H17DRAFT_1058276 [Mycena rosella]|uniref:Uncharacterized protein n=1 Tax=Mycena rosella TaxID=1033263 RepID=A0AAD7DLP3_MYCRO|nr:hypothetical protein B0H17DRAFT_1058276 [Mycena rosella]
MLEIEMQSPSFRTTRSVSAKRARSPDSPSERPAKRLSLAIGGPLAYSEHAFHYLGRSSASTSRHSSEDWVQQAGGLSIDSPLFPSVNPTVELTPVDEGMLVDEDVSGISRRPYLPPLRTQSDALMQPSIPSTSHMHMEGQPLDPPSGTNYNTSQTTPPTGSLFLPAINILPATPDMLSRTRPSTPVHDNSRDRDNSSAMSISPTTSYAVLGSPAGKRRFMMGPRANCEKCRMGVKGHWVHLD